MKAIETRYKGYRFRSRLEARWAVFFDALGLDWEYEPEGYHLSGGRWYLPDFRVNGPHGITAWYEVKANADSDDGKLDKFEDDVFEDADKKERAGIARDAFYAFQLLDGDPFSFFEKKDPLYGVCLRCGSISEQSHKESDMYSCMPCDITTPGGGDNEYETGIFGAAIKPHKGIIIMDCEFDIRRHEGLVMRAAAKARSARFEHGDGV